MHSHINVYAVIFFNEVREQTLPVAAKAHTFQIIVLRKYSENITIEAAKKRRIVK